jgi:hypothetical protein
MKKLPLVIGILIFSLVVLIQACNTTKQVTAPSKLKVIIISSSHKVTEDPAISGQ